MTPCTVDDIQMAKTDWPKGYSPPQIYAAPQLGEDYIEGIVNRILTERSYKRRLAIGLIVRHLKGILAAIEDMLSD